MTLQDPARVASYEGNGVTVTFQWPHRLETADQLGVSILTVASGSYNPLGASEYSVNIAADGNSATVTVNTAPIVGEDIYIFRAFTGDQTADLPTRGRFPSETIEQALDRAAMDRLALRQLISQSLGVSSGIGFDGTLPVPPLSGGPYMPVTTSENDSVEWNTLQDIGVTMAQLEGLPQSQLFTDGVDYTAGTSVSITLSSNPISSDSVAITFDGIAQHRDGWSLTGGLITFTSAIPSGVSSVDVSYIESSVGTVLTVTKYLASGVAGMNSVTLPQTPFNEASLSITFDGVNQHTDAWSLADNVVTFTSSIPAAVTSLEATIYYQA